MSDTQEVIHQMANGVNFGGFHESPFGGAVGLGLGVMGVAGVFTATAAVAEMMGVKEAAPAILPSFGVLVGGTTAALTGFFAEVTSGVTVNQTNTLTSEERANWQIPGTGLVLALSIWGGIGGHNLIDQKIKDYRATAPKTTMQSVSPVASSASAPVAAPI